MVMIMVNSVVRSYLSPTPVGVGVGTSLIWAVDRTLLPARVWLRETRRAGASIKFSVSLQHS